MSQIARPIADLANSGWTPVPLYTQINTVTPNDAHPITSPDVNTGPNFKVQLAPLSLPSSGADSMTLTVRLRMTAPGSNTVTMSLMQGSSTIASQTVVATLDFTSYTLILNAAQLALITNYSQLQVAVSVSTCSVPGVGSELPLKLPALLAPCSP
jgi:hypothetical protein